MELTNRSSRASATDVATARYATTAPSERKRLDCSVDETVGDAIGVSDATMVCLLEPVGADFEW